MSEKDKIEPQDTNEVTEETKPRKIMLGKRVLRHFNVKSGVRTGAYDTESMVSSTISSHIRCSTTVA